jgi:hypothetical protein
MTKKQKQEYLDEILALYNDRELDGLTYPCKAISDLSELPNKYKGLALEINDHGNVTLWNVFKNGNVREIASRV